MINKNVLKNIFIDIKELSDIDFQKKCWNNEVKNYISTYIDLRMSFFEANDIDSFVEYEALQCGFSVLLISQMDKLRSKFHSYKRKESDILIFDDPEWISISDLAKEIVILWEKEIDINDYS